MGVTGRGSFGNKKASIPDKWLVIQFKGAIHLTPNTTLSAVSVKLKVQIRPEEFKNKVCMAMWTLGELLQANLQFLDTS